jgi:hypothetical protein
LRESVKVVRAFFTGTRVEYILGLLIALVVSDGFMTDFLVENGLGSEGNPLLQPFVGGGNLLPLKAAGAFLSALILWDVHRRHPRLAMRISLFFAAFYTGVVYWSIATFFISLV